jgi:acetyl esterase
MSGETVIVHKVYDTQMDIDDECSITLRVYIPNEKENLPALVYYHGGGWVICDINTHDNMCRTLCKEAECVVVSVDYRLAPEFKFPAAVVDANAAVKWVISHANDLKINTSKIAVGGDSAGGNLAAAVSFLSRDESNINLCFQMLIYPVTDLSTLETHSYNEYATGYFLTKPMMKWFKDHYLRDDNDEVSVLASPLLADDLSELPPSLVITAEFDPLRDEGEAFAKRLHDAGVPVQCSRYNGMIHPFWGLASITKQATEAHLEAAQCLKNAFKRKK